MCPARCRASRPPRSARRCGDAQALPPSKDTVQVITFAGDATKLFEKPVPVDRREHRQGPRLHRRRARGRRHRNAQGRADGDRRADRQRAAADRRDAHRRLHRQRGRDHRARRQELRRPGALLVRWASASRPTCSWSTASPSKAAAWARSSACETTRSALAQEIMTRIQRAQLAKVKIDWGGLEVAETYPGEDSGAVGRPAGDPLWPLSRRRRCGRDT